MKRILLTGGSGFIGSALVKILKKKNKILIVSRKKKKSSNKNLMYLKHDLSKSKISKLKFNPHMIIHLAGKTLNTNKKYTSYKKVNENLTANLLSSVNSDLEKIIFFSTQYVYGNPDSVKINENNQLDPTFSPYSKSKIKAEEMINNFKKFKIQNKIILRLSGFIEGGGVFKYIKEQIKKNRKLKLFEGGDITRDYISLDDVTNLILKLISKKIKKKKIISNIGSGKGIRIIDAIKLISKYKKIDKKKIVTLNKSTKTKNFVMDISVAKKYLFYKPTNIRTNIKNYILK